MGRRLFFSLFAMLALLKVRADDSCVSITSVDSQPGDMVYMPVNLKSGSPLCGYQFDLVLPEGISPIVDSEIFYDYGSRLMHSAYYLNCAEQSDGKIRFLCYSRNNTCFAGLDGDVLLLKFMVSSAIPDGSYPVRITDVVVSSPNYETYYLEDCEASIIIDTFVDGVDSQFKTIEKYDVYTLEGRKIMTHASCKDVDKLPSGLYIIGGRKIQVKKHI